MFGASVVVALTMLLKENHVGVENIENNGDSNGYHRMLRRSENEVLRRSDTDGMRRHLSRQLSADYHDTNATTYKPQAIGQRGKVRILQDWIKHTHHHHQFIIIINSSSSSSIHHNY